MVPGHLWMCDTEVHGLVSGPAWLRTTLIEEFRSMGYQQHPYEKCVFTLPSDKAKVEGNVLLDVDDLVEAARSGIGGTSTGSSSARSRSCARPGR